MSLRLPNAIKKRPVLCIGRFFILGDKVSRYEAIRASLLALPLLISHVLGKFLNIQRPEAGRDIVARAR